MGYFISWHSAAVRDRLNALGVQFKVEAVISGETYTKKLVEELRVTVDKGEGREVKRRENNKVN